MSANMIQLFVDRYGVPAGVVGPELFVEEVLGATPEEWQRRALRAFARGERGISIAACHGPGKTAFAAWVILYSLLFHFPLKAVATAPTRGQLEGALVKECKKWYHKLPPALRALLEPKSMSITHAARPDASSFEARTARPESPEALQGIHEEEGWVLILVDEASGVHNTIYESAGGSMSGHNCQTILLSNATRTSGFFFDTWHKRGLKEKWVRIRVSHEDSARVTDEFVEDMAARYGRDSNAFRVRCLGLFPRSDLDTIIPYDAVDKALVRDIVVPEDAPVVWGVDVAYFGEDANTIVPRTSLHVPPTIEEWRGKDTMYTTGRVKRRWDRTPPEERPREIIVDAIGYGAGVADRLTELGLPALAINVGVAAALEPDRYTNLRTELWFMMAEWLLSPNHQLPQCDGSCPSRELCLHDRLASELTTLRYKVSSTGKMAAEKKDDLKARGFDSPNFADGLALTFASEAATTMFGSSKRTAQIPWSQPLSRGLHIA